MKPQQLTPEFLVAAYAAGYFPMADPPHRGRRSIGWYRPDPRAILPLEEGGLHVPQTVEKLARRARFKITSDLKFREVMTACAEVRPERGGAEGSWISEEMIELYTAVHRAGFAHSIEAWLEVEGKPALVGGLYGLAIGAAFFAESMFCRPEDGGSGASSVCLVTLARHLRHTGFTIFDVQIANPHTERFGVSSIPRRLFESRLKQSVQTANRWRRFESNRTPDLNSC